MTGGPKPGGWCHVHPAGGCDTSDHHDWLGGPITHAKRFAPYAWSRMVKRTGTKTSTYHATAEVHIRWGYRGWGPRHGPPPQFYIRAVCGQTIMYGLLGHEPPDRRPCPKCWNGVTVAATMPAPQVQVRLDVLIRMEAVQRCSLGHPLPVVWTARIGNALGMAGTGWDAIFGAIRALLGSG